MVSNIARANYIALLRKREKQIETIYVLPHPEIALGQIFLWTKLETENRSESKQKLVLSERRTSVS
jgi:hypothetical protein